MVHVALFCSLMGGCTAQVPAVSSCWQQYLNQYDGSGTAAHVWVGEWGSISWPADAPRGDAEAVSWSVTAATRARPPGVVSSECHWSLSSGLCLAESGEWWDSVAQVFFTLFVYLLHHHHGEDGSRPERPLYLRNRCKITNTYYKILQ